MTTMPIADTTNALKTPDTTSATSATTTAAPVADARALGLAHYAARGALEHVLARHGMTFQQQITLRAALAADGPPAGGDLIAQVHASLKADPAAVRATVDELVAKGLLVVEGTRVRATEAGRTLVDAITAETAPMTRRIWGGIATEDLEAAGRVLAQVAERANAELAALGAPSATTS